MSGDREYADELFQNGIRKFPEDARILILCDILATKYLLDRTFFDFDISEMLRFLLPKFEETTELEMQPFTFVVTQYYRVIQATFQMDACCEVNVFNNIDTWFDIEEFDSD